ncbi:MAG: transcriptional regulator, partial [Actinobacteria bacterium]|nr:transcriptional regulator [Actinomycetota bacterium]
MEQQLDKALVQQFARKLFGFYTTGMLTLMVDIGYRTGLFEALAGGGTSGQIAERAALDERYVREWLGAIATGGIANYDAGSGTFTLPPEHAVCLTGTSSRNLAAGSRTLAML